MDTSPQRLTPLVSKTLDIYLQKKKQRNYLKWGTINVLFLSIVMFDICHQCPFTLAKWYYLEYVIAGFLGLTVLCYFAKYFYFRVTLKPIRITKEQQKLFHFPENDSSILTLSPEKKESVAHNASVNTSILTWNSSFNENNHSGSMWTFNRSPVHQRRFNNISTNSWNNLQNTSVGKSHNATISNNNSFSSPYRTYTKQDIIIDDRGLQKYLREVAKEENNSMNSVNLSGARESERSSTNTLWNYWNNAANLLKTSIYQLSPTTKPSNKQSTAKELIGNVSVGMNDINDHSDLFKTISSSKLTKYVTNLRMWISSTILQRLVKEFDKLDKEFAVRGFTDIKIGHVGLERLKKAAESQTVSSFAPTLAAVLPFLEMSTNQEYLVQRIRELAKGSGINDYRWDSSNSFDSNWDEHVTTDAAIIFHLFCAYMDSQLLPLPQPGGRPFYNRYVVLGDKKSLRETIDEVKSKSKCAILYTNPVKPKFNFISDEKLHPCNHDRNNLFCVIIHFLIYMKDRNSGILDGVNLGRSGLNILGVVED